MPLLYHRRRRPRRRRQQLSKFSQRPPSHLRRIARHLLGTLSCVQHPGRNRHEPLSLIPKQSTIDRRLSVVTSASVDLHVLAEPWVPRIRNPTRRRDMGVMLPSCTTRSGRIKAVKTNSSSDRRERRNPRSPTRGLSRSARSVAASDSAGCSSIMSGSPRNIFAPTAPTTCVVDGLRAGSGKSAAYRRKRPVTQLPSRGRTSSPEHVRAEVSAHPNFCTGRRTLYSIPSYAA